MADNTMSKEFEIEASAIRLPEVLAFVGRHLDYAGCPVRTRMQIDVAVEELFVNIALYAYKSDTGMVKITVEVCDAPKSVAITFTDSGRPYDPLKREDPDVTLSAEERKIGGLGIYIVKKTMDDMIYEYKDGQNVLTIVKNL